MAIAAAATVHPSPPPPPPGRRAVAWLPRTHLARATVDAHFCLLLASMWLYSWGLATRVIGRLACGKDCAVVTGAHKVFSVALLTFLLTAGFSVLRAPMMARAAAAPAATDIEATKEPVPKTSDAATRVALRDYVTLGLVSMALFLHTVLMIIGVLVKGWPVVGPRRERIGSVISGVGAFGGIALLCFVACPVFTVCIWRVWRMMRHAL